jgi:hypothetical protein
MGSSNTREDEISRSPVRLRPRVFVVLALLVGLGFALHFVWQRFSPTIGRHPQFRLTAENIHITPPPPWIRSDIKTEVLRDAGLAGNLSVLDEWDALAQRVRDAFEMHPWVASVERIAKRLPSALDVELKYRRPVAAVESMEASGVTFLPIDERAIRLPDADLSDVERGYLPRISGVTGRPLVGDAWEDPRVVGGAQLAAALADVWQKLRLVEIVSPPEPQVRNDARIYSFEIITSGGTRILWGATTGQETALGESPFGQKRQRLLDYAAQHGKLESIDGPASLDVRSDLVVTPRTARNKPAAKNDTKTQTK